MAAHRSVQYLRIMLRRRCIIDKLDELCRMYKFGLAFGYCSRLSKFLEEANPLVLK